MARARRFEQQGDFPEVVTLVHHSYTFAVNDGLEDTRANEKDVFCGITLSDNDIAVGGLRRNESGGQLARCGNRQCPERFHAS